jgi:hypothetical protein
MKPNENPQDINTSIAGQSHKLIEQQKISWPFLRNNYAALENVEIKSFWFDRIEIQIQFNPARIISSSADLSKEIIDMRPCFLCKENLPLEQIGLQIDNFFILCNPYPIFREHFTIVKTNHCPQSILEYFDKLLDITELLGGKYTILYNGPGCGASAPDHMHFQAVTKDVIPIENDLINIPAKHLYQNITLEEVEISFIQDSIRRYMLFSSHKKDGLMHVFHKFYDSYKLSISTTDEPMMNIISQHKEDRWNIVVFPRQTHRPKQYFANDASRLLISPAVVDLGGLIVAPREEDFLKITTENIIDIFQQVIISKNSFQNLFESFRKAIAGK